MPPVTCVACGCENKRIKLVQCLHSLCISCLEQNVDEDGSITCPKCRTSTPLQAGLSSTLSLPDSYANVEGSGAEQKSAVSCDECMDVKVAVSRCATCSSHLCSVHTEGHKLSRATHGHEVLALTEAGTETAETATAASATQSQHHCALHSSSILTKFCTKCKKLLCERCIGTGKHEPHKQDLVSINAAAEKMRASVNDLLLSCVSESDGVLESSIQKVQSTIRSLHDQIELASEEAVLFFRSLVETIQKRETSVLNELDDLQSQALGPLEKQLARLQGSVSQTEVVRGMLDACQDSVDFVRMSSWLVTALTSAAAVGKSNAEPCVVSGIVFAASDTRDLVAAISKAGLCVDAAKNKVRCSGNRKMGSDVEIDIEMKHLSDAATISQDQLRKIDVGVCVTNPDGKTVQCEPLQQSSTGHLVTKCRPAAAGEYAVSTTIAGVPLKGSQVKFSVVLPAPAQSAPVPVFDIDRCDKHIHISNNNRTIRRSSTGWSWRSVCSSPIQEQCGSSAIQLRIDVIHYSCICVYLCASSSPVLDWVHSTQGEVYGWCGYSADSTSRGGGALGQPWKRNDLITLTLNHDDHSLTGLHHRTGVTEVLRNIPTSNLCWYVSLRETGDQVTIVH
ncbi:E3 ubiquitin-protein ligase TRIM45-like [Sycon ciliatum]|uniref:E3 ubiquitin-protein ligase TRIM45-like n=1 Tax=Sycon ciliatum TaxID=27933 RepID=UPI0031F66BCC